MNTIVLDFETYYDKEYSLSKMTTQEYTNDPRFEVLMVSVCLLDKDLKPRKHPETGESVWVYDAEAIPSLLASFKPEETVVILHNSNFDSHILSRHYNYIPAMIIDTVALARALGWHIPAGGASLAALANKIREVMPQAALPAKGTEVQNAMGKRRSDFTQMEWQAYREYCKTDTFITATLARLAINYLKETHPYPERELVFQDIIHKCVARPLMMLDKPVIEEELARLAAEREAMVSTIGDDGYIANLLRSNDKMAAMLIALGGYIPEDAAELLPKAEKAGLAILKDPRVVELFNRFVVNTDELTPFPVPTKVSKTTGKYTWAFGKTDEPFLLLADPSRSKGTHSAHDEPRLELHPLVQMLSELRLGTKSSIAQTRAQSYLRLSDHGYLAMPYRICGAHSSRLSGADGLNVQNLPAGRGGQTNALRRSIKPRDPDSIVVVVDSSQIEVRVGAWLSSNFTAIEAFKQGRDIYVEAASQLYGHDYETIRHGAKVDHDPEFTRMRQVAKAAVLSCQFGTGAKAFQAYARLVGGVALTLDEAKNIVGTWREVNSPVVDMWRLIDQEVMPCLAGGLQTHFGGETNTACHAIGNRHVLGMNVPGIRMPSGLFINYHRLTAEQGQWDDGRPKINWTFWQPQGRGLARTYTHASKIFENVVQGTAFQVMVWQATEIAKVYPVVMNSHDEWVLCVPREQAEDALAYAIQCMQAPPPWAQGLLLGAEGSIAENYGDAK